MEDGNRVCIDQTRKRERSQVSNRRGHEFSVTILVHVREPFGEVADVSVSGQRTGQIKQLSVGA